MRNVHLVNVFVRFACTFMLMAQLARLQFRVFLSISLTMQYLSTSDQLLTCHLGDLK